MRLKSFISLGLFLAVFGLALPSWAQAGTERNVTSDSVYTDGGNKWSQRNVPINTTAPVLLSSIAVNSGLCGGGPAIWRWRTIRNTSDGVLLPLKDSTTYTQFSSTYGIVLSSDTITPTGTSGDTKGTDNQGEIWGIWSSSATKGGAAIEEEYWCQ